MAAAAPLPATKLAPSPAKPETRSGTIRDRGTTRYDAIRAARWYSSGVAKVLGNVDVTEAHVQGLVSIAGKLTAGAFRAEGTFEVVGTVDVRDSLTVEGTTRLVAPAHAGSLTTEGTFHSTAEVRVDRIFTATGLVEAPSVRVGAIVLNGSAEILGDVEATGLVQMQFRGDSHIATIRGAKVVLEGPTAGVVPNLIRSVFGGSAAIRIERIEADSVELSAVDVGFVHAQQVTLGAGAHVTTVEGPIVSRHPSARVGFESRSPPPHGLSR
jgi:cytoskeletal protein CcmA (bactofilin family)